MAAPSFEYAIDGDGYIYFRLEGTDDWIPCSTLDEVEIVGHRSQPNWGFYITTNPFGDASGGGGSGGGASFNWSNAFDWNSVFQNLGNYSSLAELGAYGANNLKAANVFSRLGIAAQVGTTFLDFAQLVNYFATGQGNMDGVRFSIRTGTSAASMFAAGSTGGPYGVLAAGIGMGGSWAFEEIYNIVQEWIGAVSQGAADFDTAIGNGWAPGYYH